MKKETFKTLRCKCGKQSYEDNPLPNAPACPRCGLEMKYSTDWYIKVSINGKRHIQKVGPQKRQAEKVLGQAQTELFQKKFFLPEVDDTPLISDALETTWKRKWKNNKSGERSRRNVEMIIEITGDIHLSQFDESVYDSLVETLEDRGIEQATVNRYRAALRTVLRRAKANYDFIEMATEDLQRIRVISREEEATIMRLLDERTFSGLQAHYPEMLDLMPCLIDTGTRTSEMLKLPWQDVDFETGLITIWQNKTARPRSIPMTKRVKEILSRRKKTNPDQPWSFTLWQVDKIWKWIRNELGLQEDRSFRCYCTRHTCATRLVAAGVDIYTVMKWLGHSTVKMTERYAHLDPALLRDAANALEFNGKSTIHQHLAQVSNITSVDFP
jgi:integrase